MSSGGSCGLPVTSVAAAIVYLWNFWSYRWRPFLFASTSAVLLALAGHSITTIVETASHMVSNFVPQTGLEWCLMSIAVAFVFLFLGVAVSLSNDTARRRDGGRAFHPTGSSR
jgi:hypothetical protein